MRRLIFLSLVFLAAIPAVSLADEPALPPAARLRLLWDDGEQAFAAGRLDEAAALFEQARRLDGGGGRTLNYLGGVAFARGDMAAALELFGRAAGLSSRDARVLNNLATVLDRLGRFDQAIEQYLLALEADPSYPLPYRNLGTIYARRFGDRELAETYWMGYLQRVPDAPERAAILEELKRLSEE